MSDVRRRASAIAATLCLLLPALALAHGVLRSSQPANNAVLREAPRVLRLTFSDPPALEYTTIELVAADSQRVLLSPLRIAAADSARVIVADVEGPLRAGAYRIHWKITSADGHPVRGTIDFRIAEDASGLASDSVAPLIDAGAPPVSGPTSAVATADAAFDAQSWPYALIRLGTFAAIVIATGAAVFALIVVPSTHHRLPDLDGAFATVAWTRAARVAWLAGIALVALVAMRVIAQSFAIQERAPDAAFIGSLTSNTWGIAALMQFGAAMMIVVALWNRARPSWKVAGLAVLLLAFSSALSGHAVASGRWTTVAVLSDAAHITAAGGWLGALLFVMIAGLPALATSSLGRGTGVRAMVESFSPMALAFASVLAVTGIIAAVLRVGTWSALTTSAYGRLLLIKVGLVLLVLLAGAYNWRRMRPRLEEGTVPQLRRSAGVELAFGLLVLVVTAWLVATPPPADFVE